MVIGPRLLRLVAAAAGFERVALITDAIAATGMGDGEYELGGMPVRVVGGLATLVDGGNIAGSTLTMDRAFRRAVLEVGLPIEDAVRMASTTPARVLGIDRLLGTVAPGLEADLVVLDDGLEITAVMAAGTWVPGVIRGGRWPESRPATAGKPRRAVVERSAKRGMKP